jgi:tetratricopeptide (TPR) repeat protein
MIGRLRFATPHDAIPGVPNLPGFDGKIIKAFANGAVADVSFLARLRSDAVQFEALTKGRQTQNSHDKELRARGTELYDPAEIEFYLTGRLGGERNNDFRSPVQRTVSPLYQRPQIDYDRTLFTDLLQYAPGLHTAYADVLATLEEEADVAAPKLGSIDSAARKLIDRARSSDWQSLAIPAQGPIPGYTIHFNGVGQFTYERILGSGLGEKVVCDGKTLYHLYPEIGLASKRAFSRHHHDLAAAINPAFLPPPEELARGCDVKAVDANTIAIVPLWVSVLEKDDTYTRVHLIFAKDGRLSERRVVEMPAGKTLFKQIFHADGAIEWRGSDDKVLAKQSRNLAPAKTPTLQADVRDLVVINLPLRTPEHISAKAEKLGFGALNRPENLSEFFISACLTGRDGVKSLFLHTDRRLGYFTLLNAANGKADSVLDGKVAEFAKGYPNCALAIFLVQGQREITTNDQTLLKDLPGPKDGFIQKLSRFRDQCLTWYNQRPAQNPADMPTYKAKVMEFLQDTPSPLFAYAVLDAMQRRCNIAPSDRMLEIAVKRFGPVTSPVGLGYVGRYEYARSLYQAGLTGEAGKEFRDLYADTLKLGMLPPIDADFRAAVRATEFIGFIRANADTLIEKKRFGLAFQLAAQMDQLGDAALCDEVLAAILAKASDKERNALTLVCVQMQAQRKNFAQADRLLVKLLADKELAKHPQIWRGRSAVAKQLGQTAESVRCLEKALDLEYDELPEVVNLESIRADYRLILEHYQRIAEASASLEKAAPQAFLAKVIRTADRWRLIDPEASAPCKLAGKILQTVGKSDLAWDYWTTPIDLHPAESKPWVELGETLQAEGDLERADRAFALGFEAEATNPEILWKRAQNLAKLGQPEQARALYQQIADGSWQQRFNATVEQARGLAGK